MPRQGIAPAPRRTAASTWTPRGKGRRRLQASFRRASICAFWRLGFRQSGFRHIARAARPTAPYAWARPAGFLTCYGPLHLTDPGKPSGPRTPPPVRARSAGDTGSAPRGAPMSSMLSAPAAIPATRQPAFRPAFTPHFALILTCSPARSVRPQRSARAMTGTRPARDTRFGSSNDACVFAGSCNNRTCEVSSPARQWKCQQLPSSQLRGHLSRRHASRNPIYAVDSG